MCCAWARACTPTPSRSRDCRSASRPRRRSSITTPSPAASLSFSERASMRPKIEWPDGKKICATLTVAFEAFTRGGHFKKAKGLEVNLVSLSHANYGGNAGIWRLLEVLERNGARATVDVNGLAVQKWPDAVKALHEAGNEIAGHGTTNDIHMTDLTPDEQRKEIREVNRIVKEVIGEQPVGWVSPGGHHTRET